MSCAGCARISMVSYTNSSWEMWTDGACPRFSPTSTMPSWNKCCIWSEKPCVPKDSPPRAVPSPGWGLARTDGGSRCFGATRTMGIVMEDGDCGPRAEEYFRALAGRVNEDLAAYGFDLCDGGVMAREDKYFGPLSAWRSRIRDMVHHAQDGSQLRDLTILLDCRCVRGDATLVERLWDYIIEETERIPVSVRSLGEDATGKPVPLNFLGRLQYERDQEGKRGLNVKKYGMLPLIAGVKAIAVDHGIRATSNVERINALGDLGALEKESAEDLLFAHEFFLRLKVQASAERVFHDQASTHFIYPEEWSSWEKDNLKKAFKAVDHLQTILRYHFVL